MLVNENSENFDVYTETEKHELIFQLFKLFVIGGELCQPDVEVEKYLNITKAVYKDIVTVYR
jgi:cilia- and flagella-associated protein 300